MKIIRLLFSPLFMGLLFVVFALSMAVATFIENDFGSSAAYGLVYDTFWFELILVLLAVNLTGQIFELKLYRKEKLTVFLFHASFIVILAGAGITRYSGYEGSISIREGSEENRCFSVNKYLGYTLKDENENIIKEERSRYNINSYGAGRYSRKIEAGGTEIELELAQVIPNARETVNEVASGVPVISLMVSAGGMGMESLIIRQGETVELGQFTVGFGSSDSCDITISVSDKNFFISSVYPMAELGMMHGDSIPLSPGSKAELNIMRIYDIGNIKLIPRQMVMSGAVKPVAVDPAEEETGMNALVFHLFTEGKPAVITLWTGTGEEPSAASARVSGKTIEMTYGSDVTLLPFSLKLDDFILERYPGSNSPSGYKSDVTLIDRESGIEKPYSIYMNNVLKYRGYRFFQSSFDRDEKGTILSVNQDPAGMIVTYFGYAVMIIFIILSIANKRSLFRTVTASRWSSPFRKAASVIAFILLISIAGEASGQKLVADKKVADEFGKVLVQDQKGRTKPLFTLSSDILRKVSREKKHDGLNPMQVYLGIYLDFEAWQHEPIIKISSPELAKRLGVKGKMAAFSDLVDFSAGASYKLAEDVQKAYEKSPSARSRTDKEIMKVDERVNIVYMIYTGEFARFFPLKDKSHNWAAYTDALKGAVSPEDSLYLKNVIPLFAEALKSNNRSNAMQIAESVRDYQERFSEYEIMSDVKTSAEVLYYRANIFERLFPFYFLIGLLMLIVLIANVVLGRKENSFLVKVLSVHIYAGFAFHTFGLALRWYISGHAPMSNGYESMIFISWVVLLAGIIFGRKSKFALSATAVLGAMTLMVAHLSFMDPEITNLVPVLKSYWLTLHVSVITGSYGFLGLGAILGLINMILLMLSNRQNLERTGNTIEELTVINYKSLTLGLYFLTIGTFLGAVWANESWGRYWGWDPKETWSLITIVVYSLVIHSRSIPGLKDIFSFNILSLFAFSSVLMTYFGVNYYLSGLHSYAGGDPVPVPVFVYVAVVVLAAICFMAYARYSRWKREAESLKEG